MEESVATLRAYAGQAAPRPLRELTAGWRAAFGEAVRAGDFSAAVHAFTEWKAEGDAYGRDYRQALSAATALGCRVPGPVPDAGAPLSAPARGSFSDELARAFGEQPYRAATRIA